MNALKTAIAEIREIISKEKPPLPKKIPFCRNCAYREFIANLIRKAKGIEPEIKDNDERNI
ncbi:MAG: Dna2/Cas4 domain-containing protein [Campylobacterota bacterium]|nr:Dna2/Cas4 domain-containing protein [Campylobacterota bacterium]